MRLIDADKLIRDLEMDRSSVVTMDNRPRTLSYNTAICMVNIQPTVDAEPVRHGHWKAGDGCYVCSVCDNWQYSSEYVSLGQVRKAIEKGDYPCYCDYCGAKMDGGEISAET